MRITTVEHFQYKGYQCKIKNIDSADEYFMTYYLKLKDVSKKGTLKKLLMNLTL